MKRYETVIGLECHAQLLTISKLFCGCQSRFGAQPNTNVCPVCIGLPGALPVLNRGAVELAVRMALAVGCRVNETSVFARKNYFYPDLPKGYQISQYDRPIAEFGSVLLGKEFENKRVSIERIHIEEDAGKLSHGGDTGHVSKSGVDFNRSGVPLIEIVSKPELSSPEEAAEYAGALKEILEYTEVSDADMEKGNFRFDGNVSVRPLGVSVLGTKVEVKNLNSFRFLSRALTYEVNRQIDVIESGGKVIQETRLYDDNVGCTITMRSKEEAHDYRYFPEPDLPPLNLERVFIEQIRKDIPELPADKRKRFETSYGIPSYDASVLTTSRQLADYFEAATKKSNNPKATSNWIMSELLRKVKEMNVSISELLVKPHDFGELIALVENGVISGKIGKRVFEAMFETGETPEAIVEREGLSQISDTSAIEAIVGEVVCDNATQIKEFLEGKTKVLGFLVGQVMKASQGRVNPKLARETLLRLIEKR